MENMTNAVIEKLYQEKDTIAGLASAQKKWIRFMILAQAGIMALSVALMTTGALLYGKETAKILKKRMENQKCE